MSKNFNNNEQKNEIIIKKENINENKLNLFFNSNSVNSENNINNDFLSKKTKRHKNNYSDIEKIKSQI